MRHLIGCTVMWLVMGAFLAVQATAAEPSDAEGAKPAEAAKQAVDEPAKKAADADKDEKKASAEKAEKKEEAKADKPAKKEEPAAKTKPAEEEKSKAKPKAEEKEKPAVHTVKKGLIKVAVSVKGIIESGKSAPISVDTDEWKALAVKSAVKHGATVAKGDVLIRFDTEDIDKAIDDLKTQVRLGDLSLEQAQEVLKAAEQTTPMDVTSAEREKRHADEDMRRFFDVTRPMYVRISDFIVKLNEEELENAQEELRQLEKMYEADELTEETEEIVLTRQRNAVEQAKFYVELAKLNREQTLTISLPRTDETIREQTKRQEIASATAKLTLPVLLSQRRLELERAKVSLARDKERLEELQKDRKKMVVRSPIDGMVYYGEYVRGSWSGGTQLTEAVRSQGKVATDDVFMTVVHREPLSVRVTVSESNLQWFRKGLEGIVTPTAYPDLKFDGKVTSVDGVPLSGGSFSADMEFESDDESLLPGMNCTADFIPYLKERALVVPAKAVFTDEVNPRRRYVYLVVEDEESKKQVVEVGQKTGDNLEILDGLSLDDKILLEKPKEE